MTHGYVLGPGQGEHLILRGGNIFIRANPGRASNSIAMGTQQVLVGVGIPAHRHFQMDEAFYVVDGRGFCILDDARHPIEKGGSIFIPKNTWERLVAPRQHITLQSASIASALRRADELIE